MGDEIQTEEDQREFVMQMKGGIWEAEVWHNGLTHHLSTMGSELCLAHLQAHHPQDISGAEVNVPFSMKAPTSFFTIVPLALSSCLNPRCQHHWVLKGFHSGFRSRPQDQKTSSPPHWDDVLVIGLARAPRPEQGKRESAWYFLPPTPSLQTEMEEGMTARVKECVPTCWCIALTVCDNIPGLSSWRTSSNGRLTILVQVLVEDSLEQKQRQGFEGFSPHW